MILTDEILLRVEKPGRYIGNEINMVKKNPEDTEIRFAFCFPDSYEVGMSHLGMQILYYFLNRREDTYCERIFAPWTDMETVMRQNGLPLFSLETQTPAAEFDFIGFTLQYEMSFTNILNMLDLAGLPMLSAQRGEDAPIVCAGGPCAYNPEPLAEIIDFFYIGEGEASLDAVLDKYKACKAEGRSKKEFLAELLEIPGVYVPCFYDVTYHESGEIAAVTSNHIKAPDKISKVIVEDLENVFYPDKQLVPLIEVVHDRVVLELFRGCIRGCRFCQAGFVYRPVRERSPEKLRQCGETLIQSSGHEEISLVSLSTSDYTGFQELSESLLEQFRDEKVSLSLPSLRVDAFSIGLMEKIQSVRKGSLTFAPEAGTQRLRDVINKGLSEEEILAGSHMAFEAGIERVKLYFMVGLPTETEEDLRGIATLCEKIVEEYYTLPKEKRARPVAVTASSACFVPKSHTPFQWEAQDSAEAFLAKQRLVKGSIKRKQIRYNYHDSGLSVIEGVMARGDRRLCKAIIRAWELGARFEGWTEHFKYETWERAFADTGVDPAFYVRRVRGYDEILPWDHITAGVTREFLWSEREKAYSGKTTVNCRDGCANCGIRNYGEGLCINKKEKEVE